MFLNTTNSQRRYYAHADVSRHPRPQPSCPVTPPAPALAPLPTGPPRSPLVFATAQSLPAVDSHVRRDAVAETHDGPVTKAASDAVDCLVEELGLHVCYRVSMSTMRSSLTAATRNGAIPRNAELPVTTHLGIGIRAFALSIGCRGSFGAPRLRNDVATWRAKNLLSGPCAAPGPGPTAQAATTRHLNCGLHGFKRTE